MITAIMAASLVIALAVVVSKPCTYDYHADLQNIAYQLSRIADALNRKDSEAETNETD